MIQAKLPKTFTDHVKYPEFVRFILPSILSMVAMSFYTVVDGFFVSRYVNTMALAAIDILLPYISVIYALAMLLATGGGAFLAMFLGEGETQKAGSHLTFLTLVLLVLGIFMTGISLIFAEPLLRLMGSTDQLMPYTKVYGICTIAAVLPMSLKLYLEHLVRIDGNASLSMTMSLVGLGVNIILDALLTVVFPLGILGAGLGTLSSILVSAFMGIFYFRKKSRSNMKWQRPEWDLPFLGRSLINGVGEAIAEAASGVMVLMMNLYALRYYGENGVAAVAVVLFLYYFFLYIFIGAGCGAGPAISYSRGAETLWKEKEILRYCRLTAIWIGPAAAALSYIFSEPLIRIFTQDAKVIGLAVSGNRIISVGYLFSYVAIFAPIYYTAIGKGKLAGILSLLRYLIYPCLMIPLMCFIFQGNGVWGGVSAAELFSAISSVIAMIFFRVKHPELQIRAGSKQH